MKIIYKYPISIKDEFELMLPAGARILSVQAQFDRPYLWALVDPDKTERPHKYRLIGTGEPIKNESKEADRLLFVGTFLLAGGQLVYHLFEIV